jgi:hypothetical protein
MLTFVHRKTHYLLCGITRHKHTVWAKCGSLNIQQVVGTAINVLLGILNWLMKRCNIDELKCGVTTPFLVNHRHCMKLRVQLLASTGVKPCTYYTEGWMGFKSRYNKVARENFAHAPVSKQIFRASISCPSHYNERANLTPCSLHYMNGKFKKSSNWLSRAVFF